MTAPLMRVNDTRKRMARPESEVITYHKASCDDGGIKITVTFKTDSEI